MSTGRYLFPRWANQAPLFALVGAGLTFTGVVAAFTYYGTQKHLEVGYSPDQPVPYSHKLHAGELGLDCRYCHFTVERSAIAAVPPTQVCMNCHWKVRTDSLKLLPVRESYATDKPIPWVKIHNLPDYVYFNHSAHLASGVGCSSCHGRIDQMIKVAQSSSLTMGWCLDCHRDPGPHIRDPKDVTQMDWKPDMSKSGSTTVLATNGRKLSPPQNCSGCHR